MNQWSMKRFWQSAAIEETGEEFAIRLDGRPVRTPAKRVLAVPTRTIAEKIAAEWEAQDKTVDPRTMPWTRSANAALDKVAPQRKAVEDYLAAYAETDLLCYRAEGPASLIARQEAAWDPILDWMSQRYGVRLSVTRGVMPVEQDPDATGRLAQAMAPLTDFQLTAFHDLVTLPGSFVLGLAAIEEAAAPLDLWTASRVDEDWQIGEWGDDEEAAEAAAFRQKAYLHASDFYRAAS